MKRFLEAGGGWKDRNTVFDRLDNLDVFDGLRINLERILVEDDQVSPLACFEGPFAGLLAVLLGRPFGHALEAFIGSDALVETDFRTGAGDAVHGGVKHHHLVERGDDEVGVVGRAESGVNGVAHRRDIHGLLPAAVGDVGVGKVEGMQSVEGGADLVLHILGDLILAYELGVDGGHVPRFAVVAGADELVGS